MFKLNEWSVGRFINEKPDWGPIGEIVYKRTYARTKRDGTQEEWYDTCKRVVEGVFRIQKRWCFEHGVEWNEGKAQASASEMFERMFKFKWLPPGRGLRSMGTETVELKGGAVLNNCAFVSTANMKTNPTEPFTFLMDMSMLGVGVGFDTLGAKTLSFKKMEVNRGIDCVAEDTREGWVRVVEYVLECAFGVNQTGIATEMDFTEIRKWGSKLHTMDGTASGPEPLINLVIDILNIVAQRFSYHIKDYVLHIDELQTFERVVTSADIVDIFNAIGKCVVSGGVRRSSEIALGLPDDLEFLALKQDKDKMAAYRWASNNSVIINDTADYERIAEYIKVNGEPGIFWINNARAYSRMNGEPDFKDRKAVGANPCSEQTLEDKELCCLVEIFLARHSSFQDFARTIKFAYLYAKTVTLVPTHRQDTNAVIRHNRRIGTSVTGVAQFLETHDKDELINWLENGYDVVREYDHIYSDWFDVNRSIKMTSVKPSGTVSLLPGSTPGMHYPHSVYSIRRVRIEDNSPLLKQLESAGYPIEVAVNEPNTHVVSFPIYEQCSRSKKDVSMREQFELAAILQRHWADNQVSVTIHFTEEEAGQIGAMLQEYSTQLKSVSLLPYKVDTVYVQAPYQEITKEEYDNMVSKLVSPDKYVSGHDQEDNFCDSDSCKL